jgi:hypothetical protein
MPLDVHSVSQSLLTCVGEIVHRLYDIVKRGVSLENTLDIVLRSFLMTYPLFHFWHRGTVGGSLFPVVITKPGV